ncbi:putative virion structural protein [Erwinia phage Machina]|uniref:Putative virion structural protein n=2 Tax=Machinavirus machina TaxID=2169990 RepID=A0A1B2IDL5_9CAUD|nr:putative virion structural protein [Erwinia phage vB_EamM_Huxley]YP_009617187.1 putative virion structural protein [Erwinia phage Machina]ANZ49351.1 putative virion structural protein [Erwinia phage vB_EamM_Huxley]ANZ49908.1 putative virion structural protein [Erwinia phage Machina]
MENWLVAHAVDNAWQRPNLDRALIIEPYRITPKTGATGFVRNGPVSVSLPDAGWWHAYVVDKLHMNWGNLNIPPNRWKRVSACVNAFSTFMQLYNENGRTFPVTNAFVMRRDTGEILLAIPQTDRYKWLDTDDIYWRIFPGYTGTVVAKQVHPTFVEFFETPNANKIKDAIDRYNSLVGQNNGYVSFWVNGSLIINPTPADISTWDDVEIVVDGRGIRTVDFRCGDLPTFQSSLDGKRKYLLHFPKTADMVWIFNNDVEIQILNGREGRYYHRHRHLAIRQVTFNDISIPTERLSQLRNAFSKPISDLDDVVIRVVIREDYLAVAPLFNASHIHDLYKMPDSDIVAAMVGANATVPEWTAKVLENAAFNKVAAAKMSNITRDLTTEAYGYNAVTRYAADTPQKLMLDNGKWTATLPDLLASRSVVYEYDSTGKLLGCYPNRNAAVYTAKNVTARYIEGIAGDVDTAMNIMDNAPDFSISEGENVALWVRKVVSGVGTNEYTEAVEGTDYKREGNAIRWSVDRARRWPTVVRDDRHLFFSQTVNVKEGQLRIPILGRSNSEPIRTLWTPMETVEVWLNKRPLVFGIDYVVIWPEIVIVCKVWASDADENVVDVRARGVTGKLHVPKTGFVSSGLLSNNSHFDVRDDKVIRIVAGGRILTRNEVVFREDNTVGTDVVPDGFPFSVDDPTVPLRSLITGDTYALRDVSRDIDARTEDYLSAWYPTPPPVNPVPLKSWYHLYSPLLNKVLWDYKQGYLHLVEDDPEYRISTSQLDIVMEGYLDLLNFDPAFIGYDKAFVRVHPHSQYQVVEVDELGFAFMDRVNQRYLKGEVQLNQYLKIKGSKA